MIYVDKKSKLPLYEQVYSQIKNQILSGQISAGELLTPTRVLAEELDVGRNTVDKAYQQLKDEGYVTATVGKGFTVNDIPSISVDPEPLVRRDTNVEESTEAHIGYDFVYGSMDNSLFPYRRWGACSRDALIEMEYEQVAQYPEKNGDIRLRRAICDHINKARNVNCSPEQIVITCGHQHSMEILANIFYGKNAPKRPSFTMDDPGYDGVRKVFENRGFHVGGVTVEKDGVAVRELKGRHVDLLYLTPSHQFPAGSVLSASKRRELLNWAEETDSYIIEDDYDSELRYYTNPIPSMQSMDVSGRIIYTGTFSKAFSPVMRMAYIVFPPEILKWYNDYYWRYNSQVNGFLQRTMAIFMERGYYERQINKTRTVYGRKMRALLAAMEKIFGDDVRITGGRAGMHILADFNLRDEKGKKMMQEEIIRRAESVGVRIYPTRILYQDPAHCPDSQVLFGISTIDEEDMEMLMKLFSSAL